MDFIDSLAKINFSRKGLHHKFVYTDLKNMTPLHAPKHEELISMILNNVRQHNYFITHGNYIGYMFRLLISHLQAYFVN